MGTDIHQLTIKLDKKGDAERMEGDAKMFGKNPPLVYDFELVPELVPYRWYDIFNVIAGVRGDMFEITHHVVKGLPKCIYKKRYDLDCDYHSYTWYYIEDLVDEMKFAARKIGLFAESYKIEDDAYEAKEYEGLAGSCLEIADQAERAIKRKSIGKKEVIILFYFDS